MNIWKILGSLQTLGTILTVIGDFAKNLGGAMTGSNLERPCPPDSDDIASVQDPPPQGGMDEKPEEEQTNLFFIGGGTTVPPSEDR